MVRPAAFTNPACHSGGHSLPHSASDFSTAPDFLSDQKEFVESLGEKILPVVGGAPNTIDLHGHPATGGRAAACARTLQRLAGVVGEQDRAVCLLDSARGNHRPPCVGYRRPRGLWSQV